MKKGEQPQFSVKWWRDSQPKGLKTAGRLEDALKDYEAARRKLESTGDPVEAKAARDALGSVESAADTVAAEAAKAKGAPDMEATADALKKFGRASAAERAWIEEHTEADDDSVFADPEAYKPYLLKSLRKMRGGSQMNFGIVLGKKPVESRLAMHKSKSSKALANTLVKETSLHAMTWGTATADEDRAGVLLLTLEGRQLPGLQKKGERMLKAFKPLPFTKIALFVDGQEVADIADPDDIAEEDEDETEAGANGLDAAALARELADLIRRVQAVTDGTRKSALARLAGTANTALKGGALADAVGAIAALRTALDQVPNGTAPNGAVANSGAPNGTAANGGAVNGGAANGQSGAGPVAYAKSRLAWLAARKKVESEIDKLRGEIVAAYQQEGIASELEQLYRGRVAPVLESLDESLADTLDAATNATDPAERARLVAEANAAMQRYQAYLGSEIVTMLDDNPFVPLTIRATIGATLSALSRAVH